MVVDEGGSGRAIAQRKRCLVAGQSRTMRQNTPVYNPDPAQESGGWSVRKLKAQMRVHRVTAKLIAERHGLHHSTVRLTVRGLRQGLAVRQAIAQELGVAVTQIWPDALLSPRQRRLRRAS